MHFIYQLRSVWIVSSFNSLPEKILKVIIITHSLTSGTNSLDKQQENVTKQKEQCKLYIKCTNTRVRTTICVMKRGKFIFALYRTEICKKEQKTSVPLTLQLGMSFVSIVLKMKCLNTYQITAITGHTHKSTYIWVYFWQIMINQVKMMTEGDNL